MKRSALVALVAGLVFAIGLGVSGMTDPRKVLGFLDVGGSWDPSLAFVMIGAIGVHFAFARRAVARPVTLGGAPIALPARGSIDARLLVGAALFGVGWGVGGYCPGPALVALTGNGSLTVVAFVAAMIAGTALVRMIAAPRQDRAATRV